MNAEKTEKINAKEHKKAFYKAFKKRKKDEKLPTILEMLFVIVKRGNGDKVSKFLKEKGISKISSYAYGTADSTLQSLLGLVDKEKEIVFSIIPVLNSDELLDELEKKFLKIEKYSGIAFTIPLKTIVKNSMQKLIKEI